MGGFVAHFGFRLPLSVATDLSANGPRDGYPSPRLCSYCRRHRPETFEVGRFDRICRPCLDDTVRVKTRYVRRSFWRRALPEHPLELQVPIGESPLDADFDERFWDKQVR